MDKFKDIDFSFEKYILLLPIPIKKNQLFANNCPPFELVQKILFIILNKELDDNIYFEFSRKYLISKKITEKVELYIPELKKYYLKCKYEKYLENLNEKKIITLFRQIIKPYNFDIISTEKYENGEKFLLYIIKKKVKSTLKKIDSVINFD